MRRLLPLLLLVLLPSAAAARVVSWPSFAEVREQIRASRGPVAECVEVYRESRSPVRFGVQLRITPAGRVAAVSFDREGPLPDGARYCVRRTLMELRFPPPPAEQRLPVLYVIR